MSKKFGKQVDKAVKNNPSLTAAQVRGMTMAQFNELVGRTPTNAVPTVPAIPAPPVTAATAATEQQPEQQPAGKTLSEMTQDEYAAARAHFIRPSQKEGIGLFNQSDSGSRSEAYRAAANKQSGRTAWVGSNVEEAPKIDMMGRLAKADEAPVGRRDGFRLNGNW